MLLFEWNAANVDHIAGHDITPDEVEQVLRNDPFDLMSYLRNGEERLNQIGETDSERVLVVVTTMRGELIRTVTAHDADRPMRRWYAQEKEAQDGENFRDPELQD